MTYSLDNLVLKFHLKIPDHLKIDVEGYEAQVLEGARSHLGLVQSVLVECSPRTEADVRLILNGAGLDEVWSGGERTADQKVVIYQRGST